MRDLNTYFTLGNCFFGAAKLTKIDDPDKYVHSGYGIDFDARSQFSLADGSCDIKKEFDSEPAYNKNFLKTKIKSYGDEATDFHDKEIPQVGSNHKYDY